MAGMYGASEVAGPGKGKNRPNSKVKVDARRTARKASGMSAQKFYVTTRMAEAAKGGKTVNRKDLRAKFQSGEVTRKGFGAPKKKTGGTGSSSSGSSSTGSSSKAFPDLKKDLADLKKDVADPKVKDSRRNPATKNMQGIKGYVPGKIQKSTKSNQKAAKMTPQEYWSTNYPTVAPKKNKSK